MHMIINMGIIIYYPLHWDHSFFPKMYSLSEISDRHLFLFHSYWPFCFTGSRIMTRASFQLVSKKQRRSEASFQVDALSSVVKGTSAKFELEPPADACVGQ